MKNTTKKLIGLIFLMGTVFLSTFVQATPPTPPVEIQLPKVEALAALRPDKGTFIVPARVLVHQNIEQLTLTVRTTTMGTLGRREGQGKDHPLKGLKKGDTQTVEVQIPVQDKNGLYRIEAALHIERQGKTGVVSKKVLIQIVEQGRQRLTTPAELRRTQVLQKQQAFQAALAKKPKKPDIRSLMDNLVPLPSDLVKTIKPHSGPKIKRAQGAGLPAALKPYILEKTKNSEAKDRLLQKQGLILPLKLRGQVVFEDWYTNTPCNPDDPNDPYYPCNPGPPLVLTGLPNATVVLVGDSPEGFGEMLADTVTDENGNWSVDLDPALAGSQVYYTVSLNNDSFSVKDATGDEYVAVSSTRTATGILGIVDFGQETFTTNIEAAQVFSTINHGWNHITTEGGQDPGFIAVQYPDSCQFNDGSLNSCWDSYAEVVRLKAETNNVPDTILHEYGHGLMHFAFGYSIGGGIHSFEDLEQDAGLAFSEGWATGFALAVCPDGAKQWSELRYQDPSHGWPFCTAANGGFGEDIEGFSFVNGQNRFGEIHEGRVAAAITDFLDVSNDDNRGNEDQGQNGYEDANENDRISLATIYRDSMWGRNQWNFDNFLFSLLGEVTGTMKTLAEDIVRFNWMTVPMPITCVASKVAMAVSPEYAKVLDGLRAFRDKVMKPIVVGRHWMQSYYSHSPEMAVLLIGDSEARKAGQMIVEHFSGIGQTLKESQGFERLSQSQESVLPPRVMESIQTISKVIQAKGSKELKQKLGEVRELLKPFEGLSVSQAAQKVSKMEKAGRGKDAPRVQPLKFAPGSQQVDWELIKKNVPKGEWPGTHDKGTGGPAGPVMPQREGKE